jgi:hypothetical protein
MTLVDLDDNAVDVVWIEAVAMDQTAGGLNR